MTAMKKAKPIPTLDCAGALALMNKIFTTDTLDVSVFVDGRGLSPAEIYIIKGGNGQEPLAYLTPQTLAELKETGKLHDNNMVVFKQRRNYQYRGSGWQGQHGLALYGAARAIPRLSAGERAVVGRAVQRYIGKRQTPKSWEALPDGYYRARYPGAGLVLTFGYSAGGRYLSTVRRTRKAAPASH